MQTQNAQPLSRTGSFDLGAAAATVLLRVGRMLWRAGEERGRRRAIRELQRYDDAMLADIGLKRSDIERAVRTGRPSR